MERKDRGKSFLDVYTKVWVLVIEVNFNKGSFGVFFLNLHVLWLTIQECNKLF